MDVKKITGVGLAVMLSASTTLPTFAQVQAESTHMRVQSGMTPSTTMRQTQNYAIPAGTTLTIQEISMADQQGEIFNGHLMSPIRANGMVIIPAGSMVQGEIVGLDATNSLREIQLRSVTLPTGNAVAFNSQVSTPMPTAVAAVREQPITGQVTRQGGTGISTFYPRVSIGREGASDAAKVIGGTLGGAALGAGTGALTGLTIEATSKDSDINLSKGSMTARGVAWGAAYGAGLGLLSGLIAAAAEPDPVAVTSTRTISVTNPQPEPITVVLDQPIVITL